MLRLDSLRTDLIDKKIPFEEAVAVLSNDKDTRNNRGVMVNSNMNSDDYNTARFQMSELPRK